MCTTRNAAPQQHVKLNINLKCSGREISTGIVLMNPKTVYFTRASHKSAPDSANNKRYSTLFQVYTTGSIMPLNMTFAPYSQVHIRPLESNNRDNWRSAHNSVQRSTRYLHVPKG